MKHSGNTILITGGTSGIGLEFARQLKALGNVVIVTGRDPTKIDQVVRENPGLHGLQSDASHVDAIVRLQGDVISQFPALNVLINNAGIMRVVKLIEARALDDVTREIDIGLSGPIRMTQQFLPHLLSRPSATIVNVSSGLAFVPFPISPIYSAAKAALHAYTRCLRVQLAGSQVNVIELAPPLTETPLFSAEYRAMMKGEKAMPVKTLVRKAIAEMTSGKVEIRPGSSNILKIASRVAPELIFRQMSKVGLARTVI